MPLAEPMQALMALASPAQPRASMATVRHVSLQNILGPTGSSCLRDEVELDRLQRTLNDNEGPSRHANGRANTSIDGTGLTSATESKHAHSAAHKPAEHPGTDWFQLPLR